MLLSWCLITVSYSEWVSYQQRRRGFFQQTWQDDWKSVTWTHWDIQTAAWQDPLSTRQNHTWQKTTTNHKPCKCVRLCANLNFITSNQCILIRVFPSIIENFHVSCFIFLQPTIWWSYIKRLCNQGILKTEQHLGLAQCCWKSENAFFCK